jgi:hypothetical protein
MELNYWFRELSAIQGVPPGSTFWAEYGPSAYSGTTGIQGSYGWRHAHRITDAIHARAILANYASRPIFWADEPVRQANYDFGSQPMAGAPGPYAYSGVKVYGLDWEHCWVTPLSELSRMPGKFQVPFHQAVPFQLDASIVAKFLLGEVVHGIVGMVRNPYVLAGNPGTERTIGLILYAACEAADLGVLKPEDAAGIVKYLESAVLPKWESDEPYTVFDKPQDNMPAGTLYVIPAQIAWAQVGMEYAARLLKATHLQAIASRTKAAADFAKTVVTTCMKPDGSCPWIVKVDGGGLHPEISIGPSYDVGHWCYRTVSGTPIGQAVFNRFHGKTVTGDDPPRWLVEPNGAYAMPVVKA